MFNVKKISMTDKQFWQKRYEDNLTGWDLQTVSPPIKAFFEKVKNKQAVILIPGCGYGYEAEYLYNNGFLNTHIIDICEKPLLEFQNRVPSFPRENIHLVDFFEYSGQFDFIIEQTFFCAIDPSLRSKYIDKISQLLKPNGKLIGLLFNKEFENGPPFGGNKNDYLELFSQKFNSIKMENCINSIKPRLGSELFIEIKNEDKR